MASPNKKDQEKGFLDFIEKEETNDLSPQAKEKLEDTVRKQQAEFSTFFDDSLAEDAKEFDGQEGLFDEISEVKSDTKNPFSFF